MKIWSDFPQVRLIAFEEIVKHILNFTALVNHCVNSSGTTLKDVLKVTAHNQIYIYYILLLYLDIQKLTQVTKSGFQKSPLLGSWALILRLYGCLRRHDHHLVGEWCHFESHSPFGSRIWEWWYYSVTQASTMSSTDINSVYVHVLSSTPRKLT